MSAASTHRSVSNLSSSDATLNVGKNEIIRLQHIIMAMDEKLDMQNAKITGVLEIVKKVCQCRSCLKALVRNLKNEDYVGTSTIPTTATSINVQ